jgi:hypothetical protein
MFRAYNGDSDVLFDNNRDLFVVKLPSNSFLESRDLFTILEERNLKLIRLYSSENRIVIEIKFQ